MVARRSYAGDNLYVAMLALHNQQRNVTGYYNTASSLGYTTSHNIARTFVVMDLMVLL